MDNYKIKVKDGAESKEAQELFFELGYGWNNSSLGGKSGIKYTDEPALYATAISISFCGDMDHFHKFNAKELTLPQLRDLVAQSKPNVREYLDPNDNYKLCLIDPSDAAHWMIEVPEGAEAYFKYGDGALFVKFPPDWESSNFCDGEWIESAHWSREDILGDKKGRLLWSRQPIQDPTLISGADALRALADGKEVDACVTLRPSTEEWHWFDAKNLTVKEIEGEETMGLPDGSDIRKIVFRLKPRTIKLVLEIPAPFEPKEGDIYYFINSSNLKGYGFNKFSNDGDDECLTFYGAWRTEEEIKQVVEQLRKIRGAS